MRRFVQLTVVAVVAFAATAVDVNPADAIEWGKWRSRSNGSWNTGYAHPAYGAPVGLIVPPGARTQRDYRWGVPSSRRTRITSQFSGGAGSDYLASPRWPSDTNQLGTYYIRVPR
jgi:hypothetical protein